MNNNKAKKLFSLLRVHQYVKNLFIFMPLFFMGMITDVEMLIRTSVAFVLFSLITSSVYIFNDYHDEQDDRNHPVKKFRPIASGDISGRLALGIAAIMLAAGLIPGMFLDMDFVYLSLTYLALNAIYTLWLKRVAIIDVVLVSLFFVIRIFIGSAVTGISLSMWIVIMTFLLAMFLSLGKRRDDLEIFANSGNKTRKVVDGYNIEMVNSSMVIMAGVIIVAYLMYSISSEVMARLGTDKMYVTTLFVIVGVMRYMQICSIEKNSGSPTKVFLKDAFLQLSVLGWLVAVGIVIYG